MLIQLRATECHQLYWITKCYCYLPPDASERDPS